MRQGGQKLSVFHGEATNAALPLTAPRLGVMPLPFTNGAGNGERKYSRLIAYVASLAQRPFYTCAYNRCLITVTTLFDRDMPLRPMRGSYHSP